MVLFHDAGMKLPCRLALRRSGDEESVEAAEMAVDGLRDGGADEEPEEAEERSDQSGAVDMTSERRRCILREKVLTP